MQRASCSRRRRFSFREITRRSVYLTGTELVFYTYRNDSTFGPNGQFTEVSVLRSELEALSDKIIAFCEARDAFDATNRT